MPSITSGKPPKTRFRTLGNKGGLVERVVQAVEAQILDGRLSVGAKLPPERELSERLGVSRTVVREAVRILVTKGLLGTRHGIGTAVRAVTRGEVVKRLTLLLRTCDEPVAAEHLHQIRSILEVENAGLAAQLAMEDEIEDLRGIAAELTSTSADPDCFAIKDAEFHHRLARITHNPLLVSLLDSIHELYCAASHQTGNLVGGVVAEYRTAVAPERYQEIMTAHIQSLVDVSECLAARDANGARRAMREHLSLAWSIQAELAKKADQKLLSAS